MPVHEAIRFWQREYSRPASSSHKHSSGCDHSWSKDSKRYTYNICHLYGLEGSRISYSAHSCYSMQVRSYRIREYSLFMPVCAGYDHSWCKDSKRYTYNICHCMVWKGPELYFCTPRRVSRKLWTVEETVSWMQQLHKR